MFFLFPAQFIFDVPRSDILAACKSEILFCLKKKIDKKERKKEILTQACFLQTNSLFLSFLYLRVFEVSH